MEDSKKIGIITLTGGTNYGNVLQIFAVQEIFRLLGYDPETIKNTTKYGHIVKKERVYKLSFSYVRQVISSRLIYKYHIKNTGAGVLKTALAIHQNKAGIAGAIEKREEAFRKFTSQYIHFSEKTIDVNLPWEEELVNSYKLFVSGSDQVWNPVYKDTSSVNFLTFAPEGKRMSLSPSFGVGYIPDYLKQDFREWIDGIDFLSVREERGAEIIKALTGRKAEVLCDPTMTISAEKWHAIAKKPDFVTDEEYILTYFLGNRTREYDKYIARISREYHLKIIHLYDLLALESYAVSPDEFIYLVDHAKLVCTDSFHGAVFSIIMHTDFITFARNEPGTMESRMDTLLKTFHMENRNYKTVNPDSLWNTCFDDTDRILLTKQKEMTGFLSTALATGHLDEKDPVMVQTDRMFCCGCTACKEVCPKQCISMREDAEGFLYPVMNDMQCIHCGMCQRACPVGKNLEKEMDLQCFAGFTKNGTTRKNSSSGGLFTEFAQHVLDQNGVVYGAGFDSDYNVVHLRIEDKSGLPRLQGSKYVQSDMCETYSHVKKDLERRKLVYFSGTPCQVKGLYTFLQRDYENLITQDIICHGVASPEIWRAYIRNREEITQVSFRDKKYGWHYFSIFIKDKTGQYRKRLDEDTFIRLFLDNTILRPICYSCPLKKNGSVADITLGDCWKSETLTSLRDDDKGISLILSNTEKGYRLLSQVSEHLNLEQIDKEKGVTSQSALKQSVHPNEKRAVFFHEFRKAPDETLNSWYQDSVVESGRRKYVFYKTKLKKVLHS